MSTVLTNVTRTIRRTGRWMLVLEGAFALTLLVFGQVPEVEYCALMTQLPGMFLLRLLPEWVQQLGWVGEPPFIGFAGWTSAGLLALVLANTAVLTVVVSAAVMGLRVVLIASWAILRELAGLAAIVLGGFRPVVNAALVQGLLASQRDLEP